MIAAVLVTHNSAQFLPELLASIAAQSVAPDMIIAVDDNSTDNTIQLLQDFGVEILPSETTANDITTRIAQNFVQGVIRASERGAEIVVLGDHDDIWEPDRVEHQRDFMLSHPDIALVASDGTTTSGHTLRSTFPVPPTFNDMNRDQQWRYVAKHSIATGGASALRPKALSTIEVPAGWLHDRWWSLRAVRESCMATDTHLVISYRISQAQQVGLDTGEQHNRIRWAIKKISQAPLTWRKMKDISSLLQQTR